MKPWIQEGNEALVHHIVVHECIIDPDHEYIDMVQPHGAQCYGDKMPLWDKCSKAVFGWAVGSAGMYINTLTT